MTPSTLQFDAQKRIRHDLAFRGIRSIVVTGNAKARTSTFMRAATELDQFRDHAIERLVVAQRVVQEPAEWTGCVQAGVHQCGIFSQNILPITDPVICKALIGQQSIDQFRSLVASFVMQKLACFLFGRRNSHRVQECTP